MTGSSLNRVERLLGAGDFSAALAELQVLLTATPEDPQFNRCAGDALLALGDAEAALDHYHLALYYDPGLGPALRGRVRALEQLGQHERVGPAYMEFLRQNPGDAEAMLGLAMSLRSRGEFEQAAAALESLLSLRPDDSRALSLLGLIKAREFGFLEEGEALVRRALALDPNLDAARSNLGWILVLRRHYAEGIACLDDVLRRDPENHETRLMRAYANLRRGEFAQGWPDAEARHHSRLAVERPFRFPRWRGESLRGKTLLVYAEQGLGDQIMYASCVPDAMARGGRVVLESEPRLVALLQRTFPEALVRAQAAGPAVPQWLKEIGTVDFQIPMGSLPALFRNRWGEFPRHRGYLRADPGRVAVWRQRLAGISPLPKIGISWRGGSTSTRRRLRSMGLESWAPILSLSATFVSLQYDEVAREISQFRQASGVNVARFPEIEADYDETAALASALDLIVTVCTAAAHLSGALGRETWVLAPAVPEWRYLDQGEAMPWYPSIRIIRQEVIDQWEPVIAEVASRLSIRIARPGFLAG